MICTVFESKSTKILFTVSDFFRESKNFTTKLKWQVPPMVVKAEVHENLYCESESIGEDSDNEVSCEHIVLDQDIAYSRKATILLHYPFLFFLT